MSEKRPEVMHKTRDGHTFACLDCGLPLRHVEGVGYVATGSPAGTPSTICGTRASHRPGRVMRDGRVRP